MRALAPLSILWATLAACGGAQTGHGDGTSRRAEHFFPLSEGSAWSYDVDDGVGTVLAISRVDSRSGRRANVLDSAGIVVPYEVRDDGIFRPDKGVYLLREPLAVGASWASTAGMTATVTAMDRVVDTPAGRFTGCVEVVQAGGETGLRITTDYCPEVGPAKIVASMEMESGRAATTGVLRGWVVR
jgi:hypothetical protein